MRTTITLDPDVEALVERLMRERGMSFKEAVNHAIRRGLAPEPRERRRTRTFRIGLDPAVPWDKAIQVPEHAPTHGAEIVSFDRDSQRFEGVGWSSPVEA